jgi:hypothetical protein
MSLCRLYTGPTTHRRGLMARDAQHRNHGHLLSLAPHHTTFTQQLLTTHPILPSLLSPTALFTLETTVCPKIYRDSVFILRLIELLRDQPQLNNLPRPHGVDASTLAQPPQLLSLKHRTPDLPSLTFSCHTYQHTTRLKTRWMSKWKG